MAAGRILHATLDLLDRQLRDRRGRLCGNVDDLEIEFLDGNGDRVDGEDSGTPYVTAILCGPGVLAYRMGRRRLGRWMEEASRRIHDTPQHHEPFERTRIPIELAHQIGPAIDLAADADHMATHDTERWFVQHFTDHIPGNASRGAKK